VRVARIQMLVRWALVSTKICCHVSTVFNYDNLLLTKMILSQKGVSRACKKRFVSYSKSTRIMRKIRIFAFI
jgi:hypothetical protein